MEEIKGVQKKSNNKIVVVISSFLAVIAIALICSGFYFLGSSKSVLIQSFGTLSANIKELLDETSNDELSKKIASSDKITLSGKISLTSNYGNYAINYNYADDKMAKMSMTDLGFWYNDKELLGVDALLTSDKLYYKLKKFMDIYYYMANQYSSYKESVDVNDINYKKMLDTIVSKIKENIDEKDIVNSQEKITINGKEVKTKKLTYTVTNERLNKICLEILKAFKDDELANDLGKILSVSKAEVIKYLDDAIKEIESSNEVVTEELFDYSVYYKGLNKVIRYEISDDEFSISYNHNEENIWEINALDKSEYSTTNGTVKVVLENGKYNVDIKLVENQDGKDTTIFTVNGFLDDNDTNSNFELAIKGDSQEQEIVLRGGAKVIDKNTGKTETTIQVISNKEELLTLAFTSEVLFDATIDTTGIDTAKNMDEVTQEEINEIVKKVEADPDIEEFISVVQSIFLSDDTYYEEDLNDF